MTASSTVQLLNAQLEGAQTALGGFMFYAFAGPVPATAGEPLDMGSLHTECFKLSLNGDGSSYLSFDAPVDGVLSKPAGEVWEGLVEFFGAQEGETTLFPTFYRICSGGDDGRDLASGPRLQDTIGGPASAAAVRLGTDGVTANGANTQALSGFTYSIGD